MSIQIVVRAPGINISANLRNEALAEIIQIIQDNRDDTHESPAGSPPVSQAEPPTLGGVNLAGENPVKEWLKGHAPAEILNRIRWESYPDKILLLGAWHEARGGDTPWRSADMDDVFGQAKEKPPGNFPRDIRTAIKTALIHAETPRTYTVTRTGWNKIAQAIQALG